ncbi:MAG: tRNA (guanosine(37)-N1)-methyltransferase TrmD [Rhodobacteraceae bacterium]|nr:tRNA (guanosine(37)-N1)-methyltransferase TrmD [Paracoccaceae bacterium]
MGKGMICVGAIAGAFGTAGEIRLKSFCANPADIGTYGPLYSEDGAETYDITVGPAVKGGFAARIKGVHDRTRAEMLRGTRLYVVRDTLPGLPDDTFYISDMIGLTVFDTGGAMLGRIRAVQDYGAGNILEVQRKGAGDLLLPFTTEVIPTVDLDAGRVVANPPEGVIQAMKLPDRPSRAQPAGQPCTTGLTFSTLPHRGATMTDGPKSRKPGHITGQAAGPPLADVWAVRVITLFPDAFPGTLGLSLTGKALSDGLWQLHTTDLRRFGRGRHRSVDDRPAGGGAGMILRPDVVAAALEQVATPFPRRVWPVVCLSPRGRPFTQATARRWAQGRGLTLLCGRFEGVDERVLQDCQVEEVSLGDFVLTGGEIAAQALIDATVRLIPHVLGKHESTEEESFSNGLLEYPQYTRPGIWNGRAIPEVLLSGHHARIADWRTNQAKRLTRERRPDLWRAHTRTNPEEDQER